MSSQPPNESGSFEQISFALLLIRALDKRWTGTLALFTKDDQKHLLQLDRGLVCRVLVPDEYARLGEIVVEAGVVMANELETALQEGGLLGQALADAKLIDDKTLQRALVLQILKRLTRYFEISADATWRFEPKVEVFADLPTGVRIDTLRVLWAGLSQHDEMGGWQEHTLKRIGESPFMVRADVNLRRFGFTGDARRLVRVVRDERCNLKELVQRELVPDGVLKTIIYLLAITRHLDFSPAGSSSTLAGAQLEDSMSDSSMFDESTSSEGSVPPSPRQSESSITDSSDENKTPDSPQKQRRVAKIKLRRVARVRAAAPDLPGTGEHRSPSSSQSRDPDSGDAALDSTVPAVNAREQLLTEVKSRLARLEFESPFERLGLEPSDVKEQSEDDITELAWDALDRLSKRWHPDVCQDETMEIQEGMGKIHSALVESFETIIDPERRQKALDDLQMPAAGVEKLEATLVPETMRSTQSAPKRATIKKEASKKNASKKTSTKKDGAEEAPPPSGERAAEVKKKPNDDVAKKSSLHERALVAFAEEKLTEALRLARLACQEEPDNPDYAATAAWVRANMTAPPLARLISNLDKVLRDHQEHVTARYYRGILRGRADDEDGAREDLERVLELDPMHDGAASQLEQVGKASRESG